MQVNNLGLLPFLKKEYTLEELEALFALLIKNETFLFIPLPNGLFSATIQTETNDYTGYRNVWVRDNIHIAHAHYVIGEVSAAVKTLKTLMVYFKKHKLRFEQVIAEKADFRNPMNRPHIRFEGISLREIDQKWAHAQNDALGYFLWLYCKLILENLILPGNSDVEMILLFLAYFERINYWIDEDSGHWEEVRKINASSIGAVVASLRVIKKLCEDKKISWPSSGNSLEEPINRVNRLIEYGDGALKSILPSECIQADSIKKRRYDSALLFLIYPLQVVSTEMEEQILADVLNHLQGPYGIKRYLGDSFWSANYKEKFEPEERTVDFSDNITARNNLLQNGEEAQWCLFDSIISIIYGEKFISTLNEEFYQRQILFLNRALGQLTDDNHQAGGLKCPELYYLEKGKYVTNDVVPLLWAQANLLTAMHKMKESIKLLSLKDKWKYRKSRKQQV